MKLLFHIMVGLIVLMADIILQIIVPGFVWLAPCALILWALVQKPFPQRVWFFVVAIIVTEVASGLPLGVTSVGLVVVWVTLYGIHRIARIPEYSVFILAAVYMTLLVEFFVLESIALHLLPTEATMWRIAWYISLCGVGGPLLVVMWRSYIFRKNHKHTYGYQLG